MGERLPPLVRLRKLINEHFAPMGRTAIIGGLLRDLAHTGPRGFKSDVDIVLHADPLEVDRLASALGAVENKFGGFRYSDPLWNVDFWALERTWAHCAGHVSVKSLKDLTRCTFFTLDAVVYVLHSRELIADHSYVRDMYARQLEINLLPNPSPEGNLVRAVRRTLGWNMIAGPKLKRFFMETLDQHTFRHVVEMENRLYGFSHAEAYQDREELLEALLFRTTRKQHLHAQGFQYWLRFPPTEVRQAGQAKSPRESS